MNSSLDMVKLRWLLDLQVEMSRRKFYVRLLDWCQEDARLEIKMSTLLAYRWYLKWWERLRSKRMNLEREDAPIAEPCGVLPFVFVGLGGTSKWDWEGSRKSTGGCSVGSQKEVKQVYQGEGQDKLRQILLRDSCVRHSRPRHWDWLPLWGQVKLLDEIHKLS